VYKWEIIDTLCSLVASVVCVCVCVLVLIVNRRCCLTLSTVSCEHLWLTFLIFTASLRPTTTKNWTNSSSSHRHQHDVMSPRHDLAAGTLMCWVLMRLALLPVYTFTPVCWLHCDVWPSGVVVRTLDLCFVRSWVWPPAIPLSGTHTHTHVPMSSSINQYQSQGSDVLWLGR